MASFTIGTVKIRVGADTKTLSSDLNRAERELSRSASKLKSIGSGLTQAITLPIVGLGALSLKAAGEIEALQKGLTSVMGSAVLASKEFDKLREVAKLPGLGLEEAVRGSVNLQAAGFSAEDARRSLLAFGNALATVGKGKNELNLVILALTQLQNKTGGFGQDLRQLTEQLPQLRGALTSAFGTADSEKIQELGVTGQQVVQALVLEFEKLPKVSGGLKNAFENASDAIKLALFKVGESINKAFDIEGVINKVSNKITELVDRFAKLSPTTQKIILSVAGIAAAIGPALFVIGTMQSGLASVVGIFAKMTGAGILAGSKIVLALNPVTLSLIGIATAIGLVIANWSKITASFQEAKKESESFRNSIILIQEAFNGIVSTGKFLVNIFVDLIQSAYNIHRALSGEITFREALNNAKTEFYNSGKAYGLEIAKGINDSELSAKLGKLTEITGIQRSSGDRRESFKKLRETDPAKLKQTAKPQQSDDKPKLTPIQELDKELRKIDTLFNAGFLTSLEVSEQKLQAVNNAAQQLATNGIAATSEEFKKVQKLANEFKLPKEQTFVINGKLEFPESEILAETSKSITLIGEEIQAGIIDKFDAAKLKIDVYKNAIEQLKNLGFEETSNEVANLRSKIEELTNIKVQNINPFDFLVSSAISTTDKIKNAFAGLSKSLSPDAIANSFKKLGETLGQVGQLISPITQVFDGLLEGREQRIDKQAEKEKEAINNSLLSEKEKADRIAAIDKKAAAEKAKIQRKQAILNKVSSIFSATVSMFEGVAKALALGPAGIPLMPFIKGLGLANIAAIAAQPLPSLAIGTNYVKESGQATIHKGEAIVPAKVVSGGFSGGLGGRLEILLTGALSGNDIYLSNKQTEYNKLRTG